MQEPFELTPSSFSLRYQQFLRIVEEDSDSEGPFESFQSGWVSREEGYKNYIYEVARQRLGFKEWRSSDIGTGTILERVIEAIEIENEKGQNHRNNLVRWERRWGKEARSHHKLYQAQKSPEVTREAEQAFYDCYRERCSPEAAFDRFVELFGARYDLIAYLFFVRDSGSYAPIGTETFEKAYSLLGIPLRLSHQCGWDNYQAYIDRLSAVRRFLEDVGVPGVRLIDAHSFCWILARAKELGPDPICEATFIRITPEAAESPEREATSDEHAGEVDFDLVNRDRARIGWLAQCVVLKAERRRLREAGQEERAKKVKDVSSRPALGYDIESFTLGGEKKPIEVKAVARRGAALRFFLSENERHKSQRLENYTFALVLDPESPQPEIREFLGKELSPEALRPTNYEASIR